MFDHDNLYRCDRYMLRIKGIDEPPQEEDGFRILIDEFWPKNLSKKEAKVDLWLKELTITKNLHEWPDPPSYLTRIEKRYHELCRKKRIIKIIRDNEKERGTVTFLYSTIRSITHLQL